MKYLLLIFFCFSCSKTPDYQKMVNKTTNFVRYNERIAKMNILREKANQNIQNGKHHQFLTEKELLDQKEIFCELYIHNGKKKGLTSIVISFCSGNNYTYYFSGTDNLDSMNVIQTKREPNRLDSLCNEKFIKNQTKPSNKTSKEMVPPPPINNHKKNHLPEV